MSVSFDSNVLVYTVATDRRRRLRAREVLKRAARSGTGVLILQTLGEFSNVALRKLRLGTDAVGRRIEGWCTVLAVHPATAADIGEALGAVRMHKLAFWDAMLWATARRAGVETLLSEDLQDGRVLGGVRFVNPFDPANDALVDGVLPP